MAKLTDEEYEATLEASIINVNARAEEPVDLRNYANPIIEDLYHNCSDWCWHVDHVFETKGGEYQHIGI